MGNFFKSRYWVILLAVIVVFATACSSDSAEPPIAKTQSSSVTENTQQKVSENSTKSEPEKPAAAPKAEEPKQATQNIDAPSSPLKVHFIDVGQADSILIQTPGGKAILIDGGNNGDGPALVPYLKGQGVKKLDAIVATHPHEDHIGGLDVVIKAFPPAAVYLPAVTTTTRTFDDFMAAVNASGAKRIQAKAGVEIDSGDQVKAQFMAPRKSDYADLNNWSAVLKLTYGGTSILLTGDAEAESEAEMLLSSAIQPKATLLKVGHHGSNSSTSLPFLQAVDPEFAVISVGKGNDYGHPHPETLARLNQAGVKVYRTDEVGTIVATSDGKMITIDKKTSPVQERAPTQPAAAAPVPAPAKPAPVSSGGGVVIQSINLRDEVVTLKNTSASSVDLTGWKIVSEKGNQTYTFPARTTIAASGTLKVVSGPNAQPGPATLVWSKANIWNNNGDPGVLYDVAGKTVISK